MKACRATLLIIDHDEIGDDIPRVMQAVRYPNHCIGPRVMDIESADIGEWTDDHPLNQCDKEKSAFENLDWKKIR